MAVFAKPAASLMFAGFATAACGGAMTAHARAAGCRTMAIFATAVFGGMMTVFGKTVAAGEVDRFLTLPHRRAGCGQ